MSSPTLNPAHRPVPSRASTHSLSAFGTFRTHASPPFLTAVGYDPSQPASPRKRDATITQSQTRNARPPLPFPKMISKQMQKKKEIPGHRWRGWDPKRPHLFHITSPHPSSTLIETQEQR